MSVVNSCPSKLVYLLRRLIARYFRVKAHSPPVFSMPFQLITYFTGWKIVEIRYLRDGGRRAFSGHCTTDQFDRQLLLLLGLLGGLYGVNRARLGLIPAALGGSVLTQELPWTGFAFPHMLGIYIYIRHYSLCINVKNTAFSSTNIRLKTTARSSLRIFKDIRAIRSGFILCVIIS